MIAAALAPAIPAVPVLAVPRRNSVSRNSTSVHNSHLSRQSNLVCSPRFPATPRLPIIRCSSKPISSQLNFRSSRAVAGMSLVSAASVPLSGGNLEDLSPTMSNVPRRRRSPMPLRASKKDPFYFCYPEMTEKPKWWWRTLACLPYLMPLHQIMVYGATTHHLHPFFDNNEYLAYPFFDATGRLPNWLWMVYFSAAYLGIVRRKECPHFFRFHLLMGMLLESLLQVIGIGSGWLPLGVYFGKVGIPILTAVAFAYLFTVLESIKCVLVGMYNDIPFVSDAAYIHTTV